MSIRSSAALRSAAALSAATLALLAACADSSRVTAPAAGGPSADRSLEFNNPRHEFHTREYFAREDASNGAARSARPTSGTGISFHGGTVLQARTNVAAIYWAASTIYPGGPAVGTAGAGTGDGSNIGAFLRGIGGSPYYNINSSYTDGSGANVVNQVTYTQYWANGTNAPTGTASVTDAQMTAMLQSGFDSGKLTYDANTVYAIFSSGTVNLGGGFGSQYCAYHTHATVTVNGAAKTVYFAAMPYNAAYPSSCTSGLGSPNNDPGADAEVNTLVHEIEETTTDAMGNAWYDNRGYENADKCAWTWGTQQTAANGAKYNVTVGGKNFLVQQNWVNAGSGGCALSY